MHGTRRCCLPAGRGVVSPSYAACGPRCALRSVRCARRHRPARCLRRWHHVWLVMAVLGRALGGGGRHTLRCLCIGGAAPLGPSVVQCAAGLTSSFVCVCASLSFSLSFSRSLFLAFSLCVCACMQAYSCVFLYVPVCACSCVCARANVRTKMDACACLCGRMCIFADGQGCVTARDKMEDEPSKRSFFQKFFGSSLPNPVISYICMYICIHV